MIVVKFTIVVLMLMKHLFESNFTINLLINMDSNLIIIIILVITITITKMKIMKVMFMIFNIHSPFDM